MNKSKDNRAKELEDKFTKEFFDKDGYVRMDYWDWSTPTERVKNTLAKLLKKDK